MYGVPQKKKRRVIVGDESGTINNDVDTRTVTQAFSEAGKSRTVHSMKQGSIKHVNIEEGEDEGDAYESTQQRDARMSDSQNHEFAKTLNERSKQPARNIIHDNRTLVKSMQQSNRGP